MTNIVSFIQKAEITILNTMKLYSKDLLQFDLVFTV
jgi:hypothetical protein